MAKVISKSESLQTNFLDRLIHLKDNDRGAMAVLRRNAGLSIAESQGALDVFYRLLPFDIKYDEEFYFLIATLYPLNPQNVYEGNLGDAMATLRQKRGNTALDRRMAILLDAQTERLPSGVVIPGELGFRLRQTVKLLASAEVRVNWHDLLRNVLNWNHPEKWVQKSWARAYFGTRNI